MNKIGKEKSYSIQQGDSLRSFNDIIFNPRDDDGYGITIRFSNGFGASIQCGEYLYCLDDIEREIDIPYSSKGIPFERFTHFELALFNFNDNEGGELIYAPNHQDVEGYLSKDEIWNRLLQVKAGLFNRYEVE
tara:strand:+ start:2000 stop:2398 length:399 start_codon:yes stop_codon:yes gene_type:complete